MESHAAHAISAGGQLGDIVGGGHGLAFGGRDDEPVHFHLLGHLVGGTERHIEHLVADGAGGHTHLVGLVGLEVQRWRDDPFVGILLCHADGGVEDVFHTDEGVSKLVVAVGRIVGPGEAVVVGIGCLPLVGEIGEVAKVLLDRYIQGLAQHVAARHGGSSLAVGIAGIDHVGVATQAAQRLVGIAVAGESFGHDGLVGHSHNLIAQALGREETVVEAGLGSLP